MEPSPFKLEANDYDPSLALMSTPASIVQAKEAMF